MQGFEIVWATTSVGMPSASHSMPRTLRVRKLFYSASDMAVTMERGRLHSVLAQMCCWFTHATLWNNFLVTRDRPWVRLHAFCLSLCCSLFEYILFVFIFCVSWEIHFPEVGHDATCPCFCRFDCRSGIGSRSAWTRHSRTWLRSEGFARMEWGKLLGSKILDGTWDIMFASRLLGKKLRPCPRA